MPSPFPGMDPYLEDADIWPDFHTMFLAALRTIIRRKLPQKYRLVLERHAWIQQADDDGWRHTRPDLYIKELEGKPGLSTKATGPIADRAPLAAVLPDTQPAGPAFLKVIDRKTHRVVTVIELLSPTNKQPGGDHDLYVAKRKELFGRRINLVELDFLRRGKRMAADYVPSTADYCILVSDATDHPRAGVWAFSVREPIPSPTPIPLLPEDGAIDVRLRDALDNAYNDADFGGEIDYTSPPSVPLDSDDAAWAERLLAGRT